MVVAVRKDKIQPSAYQQAILDYVGQKEYRNVLVSALAGSGKCLGRDTPILMFDGTIKLVQDVKTGDLLMGADSSPRKVLGLVTGRDRLYQITPVKGDSWVCNSAHVLTLVRSTSMPTYLPGRFAPIPKGEWFDIPLDQYLRLSKVLQRDLKLVRTGVDFVNHDSLPYDPYFCGLWLGDGSTGLTAFQITDQNEHVLRYFEAYGESLGYRITKYQKRGCMTYKVICKDVNRVPYFPGGYQNTGIHPLKDYFVDHFVKDGQKTIPLHYLTASRLDRLKLLAGLLDTDGYLGTGYYEICTKFEYLRDSILFLARSLGFAAYCSLKKVKVTSGLIKDYWRIKISGEVSEIPSLYRDAPRRQQIKSVLRTGFSVTPLGDGDYYGFTLDGDHRFLLGDFTVTHNSSVLKMIASQNDRQGKGSQIYLAFNKDIVSEIEPKLAPTGCKVQTFHGWGYQAVRNGLGNLPVNGDKYKPIWESATEVIPTSLQKGLRRALPPFRGLKLINLLRINCWGLEGWSDSLFWDVLQHPSIDMTDADPAWLEDALEDLQLACKTAIVKGCEDLRSLDFVDMLYLPAFHNLSMPHYAVYLNDEAQDYSLLMQKLLLQTAPQSKKIFVADKKQAIYSFAGADESSWENISKAFDTVEMPLNICYRCPDQVLEWARKYVPQIEGTGKQGQVLHLDRAKALEILAPGDLIISRTNAPLVKQYFQLVQQGTPATIKGRDYLEFMKSFIKTMSQSVEESLEEKAIDAYDRKTSRLEPEDPKIGLYSDVQECVLAILEAREDVKDTDDLLREIEPMFSVSVNKNGVTLCSIHKSKGLENPRVFLLKGSKGLTPPGCGQESNLSYVGITRAQETLVFVDPG